MTQAQTASERRPLSAALWSGAAYYGSRALSLLTTVGLARLLTPEEFGVAGYAFVVVSFLDVVRDLGIGPAVVYSADEDAADTAFWSGIVVGVLAYALAWLAAPAVAAYFHDDRATDVIRVLALTFPLFALSNVHDALLMRRLAFRRRAVPELSLAAGRTVASLGLAVAGAGAWSLVGGQVVALAVGVLAFWAVLPWRPRARASATTAAGLLRYGGRTVAVNALGKLLMNADYLFVGRYLGTQALGVYTLAFRVPELMVLDLCSAIGRVVFPVYARVREDAEAVAAGVLTVTRCVALVTVPLGLLLACLAGPFVVTVFGDGWGSAVPVTRAIAVHVLLLSLTFPIGDLYKATGRLGLLMRLSTLRASVLLPALWLVATRVGTLEAVAWTHTAVAAVMVLVELEVAARAYRLPRRALLGALQPAFTGAAALVPTAGAVVALGSAFPPALVLITGGAAGLLAYVGAVLLLHGQVVADARSALRPRRRDEAVR